MEGGREGRGERVGGVLALLGRSLGYPPRKCTPIYTYYKIPSEYFTSKRVCDVHTIILVQTHSTACALELHAYTYTRPIRSG